MTKHRKEMACQRRYLSQQKEVGVKIQVEDTFPMQWQNVYSLSYSLPMML